MPYAADNLRGLRRVRASSRKSLVEIDRFARTLPSDASIAEFQKSLPGYLKANDWRALLDAIAHAHKTAKPIFWMLGAHVLKCGLSPIILEMMELGLVDLLAFNGAGAVHDLEIAYLGRTSEDVATGLRHGQFGMAADTARWFARGVSAAKKKNCGLGEGLGRSIITAHPPHASLSVLARAMARGIPALIFPAIGAEIVAQHPEFDGAGVGATAHLDFKILAKECRALHRGGVVLHFGSAVILPEVFLKALSVARNRTRVEGLVTANFDMIQHYRPNTNVVTRPTLHTGKGYSFTGHHELMIPLLAWSIKARLGM
jgi:hypothetical protein